MKTIADFLEGKEQLLPYLLVSVNSWQLGDGWYNVEGKGINATCWSKEEAFYYLKGGDEDYLVLNYNVIIEQVKVKPVKLKIFFNGKLIAEEEHTQEGWQLKAYKIKPREINEIRIKSNIFVPDLINGLGDKRELGLLFNYSGLFKKNHSLILETKKRKEIDKINELFKGKIVKNTILEDNDFSLNLVRPIYDNVLEKFKDSIV